MQETLNLFPSGAALEALCGWSDSLKSFQQRIGKYYARAEACQTAFDYIQALMCPVEHKNGWQMSEQVGYPNPYRFQHLLGRARWDAEPGIIHSRSKNSLSMSWARNRSAFVRESYPLKRARLMAILRIIDQLVAAL